LKKSAAKGGEMLAKPDCGRVLAAASFSTRVNMSKTNRFQVLKKEAIAAIEPVRTADVPTAFPDTHEPPISGCVWGVLFSL
jgi:hypothetical protein